MKLANELKRKGLARGRKKYRKTGY